VLNQSLNRVWVWVSFQVNREYIAKYICENKDRPEMKCAGTCHLMKQMAAAEQQDAEIPPLKNHFEVIFYMVLPFISGIQFDRFVLEKPFRFIFPRKIGAVCDFHHGIDHPPCL
jgi:hypothetical protein